MTLRDAYGATAAVAMTLGVLTVEPAYAQLRDGGLLPQKESGLVTVAGCLVPGSEMRGGHKDKYVLAHPRKGPVASVTLDKCSARPGDDALELQDTKKFGVNDALVGHWVEINGRLEKETSKDPDNLRELEVRSFRMVPVVPLRVAAPAPQATIARAPERTAVVATTGQARRTLPHTASHLPAAGLAGLLSFGAALTLRSLRSRERA